MVCSLQCPMAAPFTPSRAGPLKPADVLPGSIGVWVKHKMVQVNSKHLVMRKENSTGDNRELKDTATP